MWEKENVPDASENLRVDKEYGSASYPNALYRGQ